VDEQSDIVSRNASTSGIRRMAATSDARHREASKEGDDGVRPAVLSMSRLRRRKTCCGLNAAAAERRPNPGHRIPVGKYSTFTTAWLPPLCTCGPSDERVRVISPDSEDRDGDAMTFRRQAGGNPRAGFGKAADVNCACAGVTNRRFIATKLSLRHSRVLRAGFIRSGETSCTISRAAATPHPPGTEGFADGSEIAPQERGQLRHDGRVRARRGSTPWAVPPNGAQRAG